MAAGRRLEVQVEEVGEPLAPRPVRVCLAGVEPGGVAARAAEALGLAREAVADAQLVTEGGYEKTAVADLADGQALDDFLESNEGDCYVEVSLRDLAVASLWDGDGCLLARTCLRNLCPTVPDVVRRFEELLEVRLPHSDCITIAVDDDEEGERFDEGTRSAALAHAQGGRRVTLRCAASLGAEAAEAAEDGGAASSGVGGYGDEGFEEDLGSSGRGSRRTEPVAAVPRAAPAPGREGTATAPEAGSCLGAVPGASPGAAPSAAATSDRGRAPAGGRPGDAPGASSGTAPNAAVAAAGAGRPEPPAARSTDAFTQTLPQAEAATQTAPEGGSDQSRAAAAAAGVALGAAGPLRQPRAVAVQRGPPGPATSAGHQRVQAQPPLGRALLPVATAASGGFGGTRGALPAATEAQLVEQLARRFSLEPWAAAPAAPHPARAARDAYRDMLRQVALGALDPAAAHEASELLSSRWRAPVSSAEALRIFRRCLQSILTDDRVLDIMEHQMECHFAGAARAREQPAF